MNYTYILKCKDDSLYTGWTNDLKKAGLQATMPGREPSIKARRPVELVYYEEFQTREEAMKKRICHQTAVQEKKKRH